MALWVHTGVLVWVHQFVGLYSFYVAIGVLLPWERVAYRPYDMAEFYAVP